MLPMNVGKISEKQEHVKALESEDVVDGIQSEGEGEGNEGKKRKSKWTDNGSLL